MLFNISTHELIENLCVNRSMKLSDTLQASLLKLSAKGISVFSPHTSLDSIEGGINTWSVPQSSPPPIDYLDRC